MTRFLSSCLVLGLLLPLLGCASSRAEKREEAELNARRARTHFGVAVDHFSNDRAELALRELLKAQQFDPKNAQVQHGLGIAYLSKGKEAEAEQHLRRAIELAPDYQDARFNLSTLLLNQGRYPEALRQAQILYDDPTFTSPWRALSTWGWAAYKMGRVDEGRRQLLYSRQLNSSYWPTLLNLGILEAEQGQKGDAVQYLTAVLELRPGPSATAEASYRLAEIYVSLGKRDAAVGHLRTAVVRAPSDPWGKKSEEYLKLLR